MRNFAVFFVCSLWSVHALSSQLGSGLLGFALYGGASEPGAPAIQTLSQVNTGLEVTISPPQEPGGYPVIGYQYSLDGFTWFEASAGATTFVVPTAQLTLGTTNIVYLRSVSAAGTSESNATASVYVELPTFTVSPNAGTGGKINPVTAQTIAQGATTTFTVTPDEGYSATVAGTCGGSLSGSTYTTNAVTAACTVEASFTQIAYTVTPSTGEGGSISPSTAQIIAEGATTTFTVIPDSGYEIAVVGGTCGGSLSGNTYTTNAITAACTMEASFELEAEALAIPIPTMPLPLLLLLALLVIYSPKRKRLL